MVQLHVGMVRASQCSCVTDKRLSTSGGVAKRGWCGIVTGLDGALKTE